MQTDEANRQAEGSNQATMTPSLGSPRFRRLQTDLPGPWVGAIGNGSQIIVRDSNDNQDGWSYVIVKSGAPLVPNCHMVKHQTALPLGQPCPKPLQIDAQYMAK